MSKPRFQRAKPIVDFAASEHEISKFWDEQQIFDKSLQLREGAERFIFNEGPPTATGCPTTATCSRACSRTSSCATGPWRPLRSAQGGMGHSRAPGRGRSRKGTRHPRQGGYRGLRREGFIRKCMDSVFRYTEEWEKMTRRVGFWVDLSDAYVTYHKSYVESVWWALSRLYQQGLLYRGHKIVWWWPQGGTALSPARSASGTRR